MSFVLPTLPRIVSGVKKTSPPCRPRGMRRYSAAHSGKSPAATGGCSLIDNSNEDGIKVKMPTIRTALWLVGGCGERWGRRE